MQTTSPLLTLTRALASLGYGHRPSGHGVLWPATPERLRQLAAALRRRRRPSQRSHRLAARPWRTV